MSSTRVNDRLHPSEIIMAHCQLQQYGVLIAIQRIEMTSLTGKRKPQASKCKSKIISFIVINAWGIFPDEELVYAYREIY